MNAVGATRTQIPGMMRRLNSADPAMVPMPTSNCLKNMTANNATRSSGSELDIASNVAPLTSRGRLR